MRLKDFRPARVAVDGRERLRIALGAGVGILVTALVCHLVGPSGALAWIVAPMGASAVLVFGVPASPLAQPWAVVGGNTVSALVGIACAHWIAPADLAAACAVGLAIGAMLALRCLHPPGGASALLMAFGGVTDAHAALYPIMLNALLLMACGIAWNNLTGRRYPHPQGTPAGTSRPATESDLDAVLARYNQILDVPRDDLQQLINETQLLGHQRALAALTCADVMARELVTVDFATPLQTAWTLLRERHVKALPVVDTHGRLIGIVTLADFLKAAAIDRPDRLHAKLRDALRATTTSHSDKPEVIGQIMSRTVRVTSARRPLADLLPLFASTGHHHVPVVDDGQRLVGMITQSDVVAALAREAAPGALAHQEAVA